MHNMSVVTLHGPGRLLVDPTPTGPGSRPVAHDDPFLAAAKRLLDQAHDSGFHFNRIAEGPDGPLPGVRDLPDWRDEIYLAGFSDDCTAIRRRRSSLIVPGELPVAERVSGDAITVLHTVVSDWAIS